MVFSEEDNSNGCNKNLKSLLELMFPDCMVRCTMDIKRRSGRNYRYVKRFHKGLLSSWSMPRDYQGRNQIRQLEDILEFTKVSFTKITP